MLSRWAFLMRSRARFAKSKMTMTCSTPSLCCCAVSSQCRRKSWAISKEVLEAAACRANGVPYDGSHEMYFVMRDPVLTVVKAGGSLVKVLEVAKPYLGDPQDVAQGVGDKRLRTGRAVCIYPASGCSGFRTETPSPIFLRSIAN